MATLEPEDATRPAADRRHVTVMRVQVMVPMTSVPADMTATVDLDVCEECGALVVDWLRHNNWHDGLTKEVLRS